MIRNSNSIEIIKRLERKKKEQRETMSLRLPSSLIKKLNLFCHDKTFNRTDLIEELTSSFLSDQKLNDLE